MRRLPVARSSDAGVPRIAALWRGRAKTLAEFFQIVGDGESGDKFHALVAELARKPQAERATIADRQIAAIQAVGEQGLWMEGIGHINAFPPVGLNGIVDDVFGVGLDADEIQDMGERRADPFGDVGPALFTGKFGDVAALGIALELIQGKCGGVRDEAIDRETPVRKAAGLKALESIVWRSDFVGEGNFVDLAAREFTGQRVASQKFL